jgi:alpha-tubulin suppressor-like RCC1 family protein
VPRSLLLFLACCVAIPARLMAATPSVEGGSDFSLMLSRDGIVHAVGSDASGQLGQGRPLSTETPVSTRMSLATVITSGAAHNLAVHSSGSVWAWGNNSEGQLGDGTNVARSLPQAISTLKNAKSVAAGQYHSIALLQDGTVRSWGNNSEGQLGDGTLSGRKTPVSVKGLTGITAIAAGFKHSLALRNDGTVWAWGDNFWGELGNGTDINQKRPVQVLLSNGTPMKNIVAIAAGDSMSVAVESTGKVLIWGYLYYDAVAEGDKWAERAEYKTDIPLMSRVAVGYDHVLALARDGTLWAWGGNYYGQLGNGVDSEDDYITSISASRVTSLAGVSAIAAGQQHSVAVLSNGSVWRWGFTKFDPDSDSIEWTSSPVQQVASGALNVSAGNNHTISLLANGRLVAWGDNTDGQLGDGALMVRSVVVAIPGLSGVTQISAGNSHALALATDGTIWSWGRGGSGQLGNDRRKDTSIPTKIKTASRFKQIAAAGDHSLAIGVDGTAWAWGNNYYGQVGDGSDADRTLPTKVLAMSGNSEAPLSNIVSICGGGWHSAAVDESGKVWRWGYDYYDEAEDTEYFIHHANVVDGLPPARSVACGAEFTLVLARDGTVWAWGDNYYGQLGDGTTDYSYKPTQVKNLVNVKSIAAGYYHSLSIGSDETVRRWGYSRYDSATGDEYYYDTPVQVDGIRNISGIGAGDWHSLAVRTDGTVFTWGFNYAGQLADGTFEQFRSVPELAVNSTITGILDLDTTVPNSVACPVVVKADKSGSIDVVKAGFSLFIGNQANCSNSGAQAKPIRQAAASTGYQVFVAATHPASGLLFLLKGVENGVKLPSPTWAQYLGGALPVFMANAGANGLDDHVQAVLIDGLDARQLAGFDVYVGYGKDANEMLAANRVKRIFTLGVDGRPTAQK